MIQNITVMQLKPRFQTLQETVSALSTLLSTPQGTPLEFWNSNRTDEKSVDPVIDL
jgi:hypothetical protein